MKSTLTTLLTLTALLGTHTPCHADALDDLLKELEAAERAPAAKKEPQAQAPVPEAPVAVRPAPPSKPKPERLAPPARPEKWPAPPSKRRPERAFKPASAREQKIMSLFKTKIVPIADGLFKLVESKETQQLVETAKKKRLEYEKTVAAKTARGAPGRPRYTPPSTPGRGYGAPGKGYDTGGWGPGGFGGGFGRGWTPPAATTSVTPPAAGKIETPTTTTPTTTTKDEDKYWGSRAPEAKKEEALAKEKAQIDSYTKTIHSLLAKWTDELNRAAVKDPVFAKIEEAGVIGKLKAAFDERKKLLANLSEAELNEIKGKERSLWENFFKYDPNFHTALLTQTVKAAIVPGGPASLNALLIAQNLFTPGTVDLVANLTAKQRIQLQKLKLNLDGIPTQVAMQPPLTEIKNRLAALLGGTKQVRVGVPADPTAELDAFISFNFTEPEYPAFRPEVESFIAP